MESLGKLKLNQQPIHLSLTQFSSSFPQTPSSLSLRRSTPSFKCASVRASSLKPQDSTLPVLQSLPSRLLKSTCITFTAAAALFFANLHLKPLPATAATPSMEPRKQSNEHYSIQDTESSIEEYLVSHPDDVFVQRGLVEVRIKSRKFTEAVEVIDRLMELEPEKKEWKILKAILIFSNSGDLESDKSGEKKTTQEAMDKYRIDKLLLAQIRVFERNHYEALKLYQELVEEKPRDFRYYICQGIIYTFLEKQDEAEKQFDKFRKLVPRNHPYREYFVDNMVATKLFAEKDLNGK